MPMPRARFTVRRMMALVAISAALLAVGALIQRSLKLGERAAYHERMASEEAEKARSLENLARAANDPQDAAEIRVVADGHARVSAWHARMGAKYHRLARRPWLAVEPDPPEPK
jgi:hypothetical protein